MKNVMQACTENRPISGNAERFFTVLNCFFKFYRSFFKFLLTLIMLNDIISIAPLEGGVIFCPKNRMVKGKKQAKANASAACARRKLRMKVESLAASGPCPKGNSNGPDARN